MEVQAATRLNGGYLSVQLDRLPRPNLAGRTILGRRCVSDPAAPEGRAISPAFRARIFGGEGHILTGDFE